MVGVVGKKKPLKTNINKINFRKVQQGLVPLHESDEDALRYIPNNSIWIRSFEKVRNPDNHKRAFKFLNAVFEFQNLFREWEFERFRKRMLFYAGAFDEDIIDDKVVVSIWSMAFGNMDEIIFKWVFSGMIDGALDKICWGSETQKSRQADLILSFA